MLKLWPLALIGSLTLAWYVWSVFHAVAVRVAELAAGLP